MLPFTGIDFFIVAAFMVCLVYIAKVVTKEFVPFKWVLLGITIAYLVGYVPHAMHAGMFLVYSYGIYFCCEYILKIKSKLIPALLLVLPMVLVKSIVGIDFIAFAGLSYVTFRVVQIYLDNAAENKPVHIGNYVLFIFFPPTLLIGPIDRFQRFNADLAIGYEKLNATQFQLGLEQLMLGVFQKFVLAEAINRFILEKLNADSREITSMLSNVYVYSFYLYFDFAGYSSLACGLARMIGIDVPNNFNNPFFAGNPQDFWRRWHATLSDWLRDYVFRPYYKWISGIQRMSKFPLLKQNLGLFLTFFIMGIWNGFKFNFVLSGTLFGLYSVVHNSYVYHSRKKGRDLVFGKLSPVYIKWISIFLMFNFACLALYVFSGRCPFL